MKLVSWTLCGVGRFDEAIGAMDSAAPIIDRAILIDTSPAGAPYLEGDVKRWPWRDDFGAARNAALAFAEEAGATWSCMVDSDERIVCPDPQALRAWLASLDERVRTVIVHAADGVSSRERFFKHPVRHRFVGRTHEQWGPVGPGELVVAPRELITWSELPKTPEQARAKDERDVAILTEERREAPTDARVTLYLGTALVRLRRYAEALEPLLTCGSFRHLYAGWACYLAALCLVELQRFDDAVSICAAGMRWDPSLAELAWYAGLAELYAGRPANAAAWSRLAIAHGRGSDAERARIVFREPKALTWGPWDVLAYALRAIGDVAGAAEAEARKIEIISEAP